MGRPVKRRHLLALGASLSFAHTDAFALGRVPTDGKLSFRIPWPTTSIDPHDLHDPLAAIFGTAIADPPYARDDRGQIYPTLADGMPTVEDEQTIVTLRPGLRSATGQSISGRDLAWSISRARRMGAIGLLAALPAMLPRSDSRRPLIARFGQIDPNALALTLSSPLCAILPAGFEPGQPDGTGAFRAIVSGSSLVLERNLNASRGASFLEKVSVHRAKDLADSLRAFESGQDDIGWLGMGFHGDRPKARKFDYREVGWIILCTGDRAGRYGAPGVAQQLCDGIPVERLGVGLPARGLGPSTTWGAGAANLIFDAGSGHLRAIAEAVAPKLSQPGHEITPKAVSRSQLRSLRQSRNYALALDVVRHPISGPFGVMIALATADDPSIGQARGAKPPLGSANKPPAAYTATLRVGILGDLSVQGGVVEGTLLAPSHRVHGVDWGGSYRGW